MARLGLGTVQFGLDYGISNTGGRPTRQEVTSILDAAARAGVSVLDTAPAYGNSENVLGECLVAGNRFRIVTKTPIFPVGSLDDSYGTALIHAAHESSRKLGGVRLGGLLVHHANHLTAPGGHALVRALRALKDEGLIEAMGVSVYDGDEIDRVLEIFTPDLVQLPINALDRRLIASGHLRRLKDLGVEIHARSVFLQGLLLMDPNDIPGHFAPIRPQLAGLHAAWKDAGLTPLAGCLAFAMAQPDLDIALVGVNSVAEMHQIAEAATAQCPFPPIDEPVDPVYVNPARWPKEAR